MENGQKLRKTARVMVKDGTFKNKAGEEKNSYHEVGVLFETPDRSRMSIKLHATITTEEKWLSVFFDKDDEQKADGANAANTANTANAPGAQSAPSTPPTPATEPAPAPTQAALGEEINIDEIPF